MKGWVNQRTAQFKHNVQVFIDANKSLSNSKAQFFVVDNISYHPKHSD